MNDSKVLILSSFDIPIEIEVSSDLFILFFSLIC